MADLYISSLKNACLYLDFGCVYPEVIVANLTNTFAVSPHVIDERSVDSFICMSIYFRCCARPHAHRVSTRC